MFYLGTLAFREFYFILKVDMDKNFNVCFSKYTPLNYDVP